MYVQLDWLEKPPQQAFHNAELSHKVKTIWSEWTKTCKNLWCNHVWWFYSLVLGGYTWVVNVLLGLSKNVDYALKALERLSKKTLSLDHWTEFDINQTNTPKSAL